MNCDVGNDYVTILDMLLGILCVGQDYKTGVQFGHTFPISATAQHSTQASVITGGSVECGDHDFSSENITPSATLWMNLVETPG